MQMAKRESESVNPKTSMKARRIRQALCKITHRNRRTREKVSWDRSKINLVKNIGDLIIVIQLFLTDIAKRKRYYVRLWFFYVCQFLRQID